MFFLELLSNFVNYMSYSLYEEVFSVFDKLLVMSSEVITEAVLKKCIVALVDKYTLKSKSHKNSLQTFMKSLIDIKIKKNDPQRHSMSGGALSRSAGRRAGNLSGGALSSDFDDIINE